jgi:hypothetical protein
VAVLASADRVDVPALVALAAVLASADPVDVPALADRVRVEHRDFCLLA